MRKFIIRLIIFLITLIVFSYVFTWFYEIPEREAYKEGTSKKLKKWKSIKDTTIHYDVIILGSSRGYSAYNPIIIDSITKMNTYNMCTGAQHIIESYYMFKEILKYQKPKYLVYDIFLPSFRKEPDYYQVFSNAKFMSNEMMYKEFLSTKIMDFIFPVFKHKVYLKEKIYSLFKKKGNKKSGVGTPWIKGYKPSNKVNDSISIRNFSPMYNFSNTNVLSEQKIKLYLQMLRKLCENNSVELRCIRAPFPPSRLKKISTDTVNKYFEKFLLLQNIPFLDLNYKSKELFTDYDFEDYHHLNSVGAKKASIDLAYFLKNGNTIIE